MKKIVFSATGRTEKCADAFCSVSDNVDKIDLSVKDFENITLSADDFCLVAMPVYGGRVPGCAVDNMAKINANGAKAVIMAVYGNRAYDNALAEIKAVCEKQGFTVIAGCAAIAQHSMLPQVAENRPDEKDIVFLKEFALNTKEKADSGNFTLLSVPGKAPDKPASSMPVHPKANDSCIKCGLCADRCPAGAIDRNNPLITDKSECITCMRCVEICPQNARVLLPGVMKLANPLMKKVWGKYKEIEFFI